MARLVFSALALLGAILVLDRLLLWMESRGWIYWRRTKKRGGGALYHVLETHSVFEPGVEEIIEVKYGEEQEEDDSGAPPGPGGDEPPPAPGDEAPRREAAPPGPEGESGFP